MKKKSKRTIIRFTYEPGAGGQTVRACHIDGELESSMVCDRRASTIGDVAELSGTVFPSVRSVRYAIRHPTNGDQDKLYLQDIRPVMGFPLAHTARLDMASVTLVGMSPREIHGPIMLSDGHIWISTYYEYRGDSFVLERFACEMHLESWEERMRRKLNG